jgi:hypothetical protein
MFALSLANDQHLASCNLPLVGIAAGDYCWNTLAGAPHTPNSCATKVYASPPPAGAGAPQAFEWNWLSTCQSGLADPMNPCVGEEVRCVDGTRPGFYIDWATDDAAQEAPSDRWIVYWSGGGRCTSAEACWDDYTIYDPAATSTCTTTNCPLGSGQSIVSRYASWTGLLSGSPENDFHDWNRIKLHKCSDDSFQGTTTETGGSVGAGAIGEVYHQGHAIVRRVLTQMSHPANLPGYPKLDAATSILLVGNSGGGKTLALTGDGLRDFLLTDVFGDPDPPVKIRLVVDSQFLPSLEFENALVDGTQLYQDDQWRAPDPGVELPEGEVAMASRAYGTFGFMAGRSFIGLQAFQPPLDTSCLATHPAEPERCNDELHVLLHHVTTPTFVRMDVNDDVKREGAPNYADDSTYRFYDADFHARVSGQLSHWMRRFQSHSELATNADTSPAVPTDNARKPAAQNIAVWAPMTSKAEVHTGLLEPEHFGFPSTLDPVELEACKLTTGQRGTASPETGFAAGFPTTAMRALHAWVSDGTAIDATVGYTSDSGAYRWQEPGEPCAAMVPARGSDLVFLIAFAVLALGTATLTGVLRFAHGPR